MSLLVKFSDTARDLENIKKNLFLPLNFFFLLVELERNLGLFYRWFSICRHHLKADSTRAPFWARHEEQVKEKSSCGKYSLWAVSQLCILSGRRNSQSLDQWHESVSVHGLWLMIWLDGHELGEDMIGKLVKNVWGKKYADRPLWMGRNYEYLCLMWMHNLSRGGL